MKYINFNGGLLKAGNVAITYDNSSFKYGYGLFETMLCTEGTIRLKEYHWERLFEGLKQLNMEFPGPDAQGHIEEEALKTVRKNNMGKLCRIRLQVFPSAVQGDDNQRRPEFIVECIDIEAQDIFWNESGFQVGMASGLAKSADSIANLKSCSALIYALAAGQAKAAGWNDVLIRNTLGNIIESSIANIFLVKRGLIYTPPLTDGCVSGVMRRHIINSLKKNEITVIEKSITEDDINSADELFLSNAIKGIKWVGKAGNTAFGNRYSRDIYGLLFDL